MPDRLYISAHTPPHVWDRVLAHPGSVCVGAWSTLAGLLFLLDAFLPEVSFSVLLQPLPDTYRFWFAGALAIGGSLVLLALLRRWERVDTSWRLERGGWSLVAGAWAAMSILAISISPVSILPWGSFATMAAAAVLRGQAVRRTEKTLRDIKAHEETQI